MKVHSYAAREKGGKLTSFEYELGELSEYDVRIKISHCGLCHSDLHLIDDDWQMSEYPLVPGHEIVGEVEKLGNKVSNFKKGDRVGVGWQCGSCLVCDQCKAGYENLCSEKKKTCVGRYGGFADHIDIDGRFVYQIPESLSSAGTAPLMCAGLTVYQPMKHFGVKSGMKVGVIGLGGLGHMAVKFAKAFGCKVTVFSTSSDKRGEARKLGADRFVTDPTDERLNGTLDFIIDTAPASIDWDRYMEILAPLGKLCVVGIPEEKIEVSATSLIGGQKLICGGSIGDRNSMKAMLKFAAEKGIEAQVEVMPMSKVNEAIKKLRKGKVRYRVVLEN